MRGDCYETLSILWEEDALDHVEVLHQHVSLRFGAEVTNSVTDSQLDGSFQSRGGGLRGGEQCDPWCGCERAGY